MPMTGFFCQDEYLAKTAKLTDEEVGRLFRSLMVYHATGEITDLDGRESIAFDFIREDIDKAEDAYQKKCKQASENRRKALETELTPVNARQRPSTPVNECDHNNINKRDINKNKKDISPLFDRFWNIYPRHVAKQNALKAFEKINPDDQLFETIIKAVERQKGSEQWTKDGGQFIPHPATWLNQRRWEDELPAGTTGKIVSAQGYSQRDYEDEDAEAMKRFLQGVTA